MWKNDICKVSMMQDEYRHQADYPTEYPIPKVNYIKVYMFVR